MGDPRLSSNLPRVTARSSCLRLWDGNPPSSHEGHQGLTPASGDEAGGGRARVSPDIERGCLHPGLCLIATRRRPRRLKVTASSLRAGAGTSRHVRWLRERKRELPPPGPGATGTTEATSQDSASRAQLLSLLQAAESLPPAPREEPRGPCRCPEGHAVPELSPRGREPVPAQRAPASLGGGRSAHEDAGENAGRLGRRRLCCRGELCSHAPDSAPGRTLGRRARSPGAASHGPAPAQRVPRRALPARSQARVSGADAGGRVTDASPAAVLLHTRPHPATALCTGLCPRAPPPGGTRRSPPPGTALPDDVLPGGAPGTAQRTTRMSPSG